MRINRSFTAGLAALLAFGAAAAAFPPSQPAAEAADQSLPYTLRLGQVSRDGTRPTNQAGFTTSAVVEREGADFEVRARVRANAAGQYVVDVETFDAIGRRLDQQWDDNAVFSAGQVREVAFIVRLAPGASGPFTVKVGVFEPGPFWGALLHWNDAAATFNR